MAAIQNLVIDQGTTFERTFDLTDANGLPVNLTEFTPVAHIRRGYSSNSGLMFTSTVVGAPTAGSLSISLTAAETMSLKYGRYVYDIKLTRVGEELRVVEGIITITPAVTR